MENEQSKVECCPDKKLPNRCKNPMCRGGKLIAGIEPCWCG